MRTSALPGFLMEIPLCNLCPICAFCVPKRLIIQWQSGVEPLALHEGWLLFQSYPVNPVHPCSEGLCMGRETGVVW